MKQNLLRLLVVAAIGIITTTCQDPETLQPEEIQEYGTLVLNISLQVEDLPISGKLKEVNTDGFIVTIHNAANHNKVLRFEPFSEAPPEIELQTGEYYVKATNLELPSNAAWDQPWYYGESEVFNIDKEELKSIDLICTIANCKLSFTFSQNVVDNFTEWSATGIHAQSGETLYWQNEQLDGEGYFLINSAIDIGVQLFYQKVFVNETITRNFATTIYPPQPATHYRVNVDATLEDGKIVINLTVDDSYDEVDITLGDDPVDPDFDEDGYTISQGDCDDSDPNIHPGAVEICDGLDNDCDGVIPADEYTDNDGDGYLACDDCDDNDPNNFPGNVEVCDGTDNDCVGGADYPGETTDNDSDGYFECQDCDDSNADVYPGATEIADGLDNNCDGFVDEGTGGSFLTAFDWRTEIPGAISPIKNQGGCGVCWIFSSLGMIEARANIQSFKLGDPMPQYDLSEKYVMACHDPNYDWCSGGWPVNVLQFVRDDGVVFESCYQYGDLRGSHDPEQCPISCPDSSDPMDKLRIDGYETMYNPTIEEIKQEVYDNGPVVITFDVYSDFYNHTSGVYSWDGTSTFLGATARIIVGWGDENGIEYWIVKMDWGEGYFEDGYVKMSLFDSQIRYFQVYKTTGGYYIEPESL